MTGQDIHLEQELTAIWRGGLAGIFGSLSMLAVFGFLAASVRLEMLTTKAETQRFPGVKPYRIVENTYYLLTLALWAMHAAALFVALRSAHFAGLQPEWPWRPNRKDSRYERRDFLRDEIRQHGGIRRVDCRGDGIASL